MKMASGLCCVVDASAGDVRHHSGTDSGTSDPHSTVGNDTDVKRPFEPPDNDDTPVKQP